MTPYRALLFDLCDTIMPFDNARMPLARVGGTEVRSTSPLLYRCFTEYYTHMPYEEFHDHFVKTTEAVAELRAREGEEVLSSRRFELFLERLAIDRSESWFDLHRNFLETHLSRIAECLALSPENRALLENLKKRYRIGLVSNFDDTDTAYRVLKREGVHGLFEVVIISAEIGLRKPRSELFLSASRALSVRPDETLFIGDHLFNDVGGAKQVGMHAAWINPARLPLPEGAPTPDYILSGLTDLLSILQ